MLAYLGFDLSELPWPALCDDWARCKDYRTGQRGTFVARRVAG